MSIADYCADKNITLSELSEDIWFIGSPEELSLKKKIERLGTPLKEWDVKIIRGILTGFNEAFIIDEDTRAWLISEDAKSEEIIKPILRGRDIKRYGYEFAGLYLINTHNGYTNEGGDRVERIEVDDYPAIKNHLNNFYERLLKRQDQGDTPYNLRDCAYLNEFEQEKIIWQEMSQSPKFSYSDEEIYVNDTCRLLSGEYVKFLFAYFNSSLFFYAFKNYYAGDGLGKKGIRFKNTFMQNVPVPVPSKEVKNKVEDIADEILQKKEYDHEADTSDLENQIDQLVYQLYNLTPEEIKIVEENSRVDC